MQTEIKKLELKIKKQTNDTWLIKKITEAISATLDLEEILKIICNELLDLFKVDRVAFGQINLQDLSWTRIIESAKNPMITAHNSSEIPKELTRYLVQNVIDPGKHLAIDDINSPDTPEVYKKVHNRLGTKSILNIPVKKGNDKWGVMAIYQNSYYRKWTEEEIELVSLIIEQVFVAIKQSELYENLKKHAEREALLRKITLEISSSHDYKEIQTRLVTEVGKLFNADKCFIRPIDQNKNSFLPVDIEYLSSPQFKKEYYLGKEVESYAISEYKKGNHFAIPDAEELKNNPNPMLSSIGISLVDRYNIRANYCYPMIYKNNLIGCLIIQFINQTCLTNEDLQLIETLVNQAAIALGQAQLLDKTKCQAKREKLLRKISETIRTSLDINQTKKNIVNEVGKAFNIDRCYISLFNEKTGKFIPIDDYSEYRSSENIKSIIGFIYDSKISSSFAKLSDSKKPFLLPDIDEYAKNLDQEKLYIKEYFDNIDTKSNYGFPMFDDEKLIGRFVLHFTQKVELSLEEIELLEVIANQAAMAIKQANLYSTILKQSQREELIRNIISTAKETLDLNEVKSKIVNEIGKNLNADRCVIHQVNPETDRFLIIDNSSEYLSSIDIPSFVGIDLEQEELNYFKKRYLNKEELIAPDWTNYLENLSEINTHTKKLISKLDIKSNYVFPITNNNKLLATLYLTFTKEKRVLTSEELEFIRMLSAQIGITINQANQYTQNKEKAEKEKLLREIALFKQENFTIKEVLTSFCCKIAQSFDVQSVVISDLKNISDKSKFLTEYKQANVNDSVNIEYNEKTFEFWTKEQNPDKVDNIIINSLPDSHLPDYFKKDYLKVKSLIAVPIKMDNLIWGWIALFEYQKYRNWSKLDIYFLEFIAEHISVFIKEKKLYTQSEFLSNITHELKTPISIIYGYTEALLLENKNKSKLTDKFLKLIRKNLDRTNGIINDLLHISRLENDLRDQQIKLIKADLCKIINEALTICSENAKSRNIELIFEPDRVLLANVSQLLMQQAIINLVNNAINYSENNSKVEIILEKANNKVLIKVKDYGCGIKQDDLHNIFERFYRVDKSRSRNTGGTGLGLSIVKKIVELHNGNISVESCFGKGSTFIIYLPMK